MIDEIKLSSQSASLDPNTSIATVAGEINDLQKLIAGIKAKIEAITNQIKQLAEEIITKKLKTETVCVGPTGEETCINKDQLDELIKLLPSPSPISSAPLGTVNPSPETNPSPEATASASPAP